MLYGRRQCCGDALVLYITYEVLGNVDLHGLVGKAEDGDDLTHAVGAVVEEEKGVAVWTCVRFERGLRCWERRTLDTRLVAADDDGLQELVGLVLFVAVLDCGDRVLALLTLAVDETVDGDLDALPALVAVHGVVPPDDGRDLADVLLVDEGEEVLEVPGGGAGRGIATVAEEVDVDVLEADLFRGLEEGVEVGDVGVDAAVGYLEKQGS